MAIITLREKLDTLVAEGKATKGNSTATHRVYRYVRGSTHGNPHNMYRQVHAPSADRRLPTTGWFVDGVRIAFVSPNTGQPILTPEGRKLGL